MVHMACLPEGTVALRDEIARAYAIPSSSMAKILQSLVRARLLRSSRGVHGGFTLARAPGSITLLDIMEAIEGPLGLTDCTPDAKSCEWSRECPASRVWHRVQKEIVGILRKADLHTLASSSRRTGRVVYLPTNGSRKGRGKAAWPGPPVATEGRRGGGGRLEPAGSRPRGGSNPSGA
jgi:Rrf2 family protein